MSKVAQAAETHCEPAPLPTQFNAPAVTEAEARQEQDDFLPSMKLSGRTTKRFIETLKHRHK
jgi:hypothetical protein